MRRLRRASQGRVRTVLLPRRPGESAGPPAATAAARATARTTGDDAVSAANSVCSPPPGQRRGGDGGGGLWFALSKWPPPHPRPPFASLTWGGDAPSMRLARG